ncbi:MAG: Trk system potassium transporter TrkA [Peptostreptococcaceae bacterium]
MNIVIIGNGKIGSELTKILCEKNHDVVIIDKNYSEINKIINNYDVKAIHGNGASYETQRKAGVDKADLLISVTPYDEINLISCFISKKLGVKRTIAIISNFDYHDNLDFFKINFEIDLIINPEKIVARSIVNSIIYPSYIKLKPFFYDEDNICLTSIDINKNNKYINKDLHHINKKNKSNALIYGVIRRNNFFIVNSNYILEKNDRIYLLGTYEDLNKILKTTDNYEDDIKSVIIIGGGKLSIYIANLLIALDIKVKIIEADINKCRFMINNTPKARIINEDGTLHDVLVEEGISSTDAFISITGTDEKNLFISMFASHCNLNKIITKIDDLSTTKFLEFNNSQIFISPKDIIANNIVKYIEQCEDAYNIDINVKKEFNVIKLKVKLQDTIINKKIKDINLHPNISIISIIRNNQIIIPSENDYIKINDSILIISLDKNIREIDNITC